MPQQISTLADNLNRLKANNVIWSDIPNNFDQSPFSGDLALVINNDAVAQSLENLVLTFLKERPYNYSVGSSIAFRAFENSSDIEQELIKVAIQECVAANEPRVIIRDVIVTLDSDNNQYSVSIYYSVINISDLQKITILIKRLR